MTVILASVRRRNRRKCIKRWVWAEREREREREMSKQHRQWEWLRCTCKCPTGWHDWGRVPSHQQHTHCWISCALSLYTGNQTCRLRLGGMRSFQLPLSILIKYHSTMPLEVWSSVLYLFNQTQIKCPSFKGVCVAIVFFMIFLLYTNIHRGKMTNFKIMKEIILILIPSRSVETQV